MALANHDGELLHRKTETGLQQLRCGECGETKHNLFIRLNGEIIAECIKCKSQSEIVITEPKIVIKNNAGSGTLYPFTPNKKTIHDGYRIPRSVIKETVSRIIVDKLGVDDVEVTKDASFRDDLGADSLDTVELIMDFEKEFNIEIRDEDAERVRTVGDAVDELYRIINN